MKKIYALIILALFCTGAVNAQDAVYFDPFPVPVNGPVKLYVDITSAACNCPELQDANPDTNPLYFWTWNPAEERPYVNGMNILNGYWNNSNENLIMRQDSVNPNLWYFSFVEAPFLEFYGVNQQIAMANGFSFLVKEKNGAPMGEPEQKSIDMGLDITFDNETGISDFSEIVASLEAYPNPVVEVVRVKTELRDANYSNLSIRIVSIDGRTIMHENNVVGIENGIEINVSDLASGVYMFQLV
ncbi:T9SS type A sorting domain-containing protein [Cryomorpha ignava]|uniref:T9SS type A sorting domain-containing protein n=1 Tax=Cryomorpha ignava TaxID=101383 RepID=A0A7K3WML6_9FLAO|nr:T9SS type A sorting domain-containing protein [Cryomorpha ignava]NEN22768.1 T9SS type A sorting domain-containing protein [Cryomorpha ignava]